MLWCRRRSGRPGRTWRTELITEEQFKRLRGTLLNPNTKKRRRSPQSTQSTTCVTDTDSVVSCASNSSSTSSRGGDRRRWVSWGFSFRKKFADGTTITICDPEQVPDTPPSAKRRKEAYKCISCDKAFVGLCALRSHERHKHKKPVAKLKFAKVSAAAPAPAPPRMRRRVRVLRYKLRSMYPLIWRHLEFRVGLSINKRNIRRRVVPNDEEVDGRKFNGGARKRARVSLEACADVLHARDMAIADGKCTRNKANAYIDRTLGLKVGACGRYNRKRDHVLEHAAVEQLKRLKGSVSLAKRKDGHYWRFPHADKALYRLFRRRRKFGRFVTKRWLLVKRRLLVRSLYPIKGKDFNGSDSSLDRPVAVLVVVVSGVIPL